MKKLSLRLIVLLALALLIMIPPALAHEGREVGDYHLTFGWLDEPAFAGLRNGPEIFIQVGEHDDGGDEHEHPLPEVNLQAEVSFGDQTTTVSFRPAFGETGHYIAELIPTLPGDYSFHVTGTIGDTEVDVVFTSADGEFSSVEPASDVMFPALPLVDNARIEALEARIAELEAQIAALAE